MSAIVIELQREIGVLRKGARPAAEHVAAAHHAVTRAWLREPAVVGVALYGKTVDRRGVQIEAEASLPHVPVIGCGFAVRQRAAIPVEIFAVDSNPGVGAHRAAIAQATNTM